MPQTKPPYAPGFRQQMVELVTVYSTLGARVLPEGIEVTFAPAEERGTAPAPQV